MSVPALAMEHFTSQKGVAAVLGVLDDMFGHADNAPSSGESSEESDHTYMSESVSSSFSSVSSPSVWMCFGGMDNLPKVIYNSMRWWMN